MAKVEGAEVEVKAEVEAELRGGRGGGGRWKREHGSK